MLFFCTIKGRIPNKLDKRVFLLLFFPLISNFIEIGFFLLCIWLLGTIVLCIYKKSLNWNLVVGLCSLTVGYLLVDFKLFYMRFVLNEPLNRALTGYRLKGFSVNDVFHNFVYGSYHAPFLASKVIIPTIFFTLLFLLFLFCINLLEMLMIRKIKKRLFIC